MGRHARVVRRVGHRGLRNGQRGQVSLLFSNDGITVKLPLCVRTRPCSNMNGVDVQLLARFASILDAGGWSASRSGIFTPRYSSRRIYGSSRTGLDDMTHIAIPAPAETRISSVQPVQNYPSSHGYSNDRCQYAVLDKNLL